MVSPVSDEHPFFREKLEIAIVPKNTEEPLPPLKPPPNQIKKLEKCCPNCLYPTTLRGLTCSPNPLVGTSAWVPHT